MQETEDIVVRLQSRAAWVASVSTEQLLYEAATTIATLRAEVEVLRDDAAKSERRAITFGDILAQHILAMRAAVVAGHLESHAHGLQWIVNTLAGPGHLPDLDEARALGGAQALFDKEMAEHEAFRAAHPVPDAAIDAAKADKEGA